MKYTSLSISFRIGLAFHAMNNEGSNGTNVMEPRRISVGGQNYDGISGEMVRRHVFENLVEIARNRGLPLSPDGEGLLPDRAKNLIKSHLQTQSTIPQTNGKYALEPKHLPEVTRAVLEKCTITDIGGYLAAFEGKDGVGGAVPKRDSVFDVGWLISEEPAIVEFAQHAAYRPDGQHNLFTQNMRAAVYGGVTRLDLGRVGKNDWAWLTPTETGLHLDDAQREARAQALLDAWEQWLLSPSGAKQAGWLQHVGELEGVIVLSNFGPAPFRSPIEVKVGRSAETGDAEEKIQPNPSFKDQLFALENAKPDRYKVIGFHDQAGLVAAFEAARQAIFAG